MRSLERVRKAIAGEPVDCLPVQPMLMMFAARHAGIRYIDYTRDGRKMAEAQLRVAEDFDIDVLLTCSDPAREVIDMAGEGSVDWFVDQGPAINESRAVLADMDRLRGLRVPDPQQPGRMHDRLEAIEIMHRAVGGEKSIVGWVEGPLALAAELRGINQIMMDFIEEETFVADLLDLTADVAIAYAEAQIQAGADTIGMSDAAASMMGPDLYARFLHPRQDRVLRTIKRRHPEVLTRSHMCGRVDELLASMRTLPVDIYELDFPTTLSVARAELGQKRVISGNVSTMTDMMQGTPEQVYAAAGRCHQVAGKYHIVNCGCEVSPITSPDNVRALVRYAREHQPLAAI